MISNGWKYILFLGSALLVILSANACEEDVPELSGANRIIADSIVRLETKLIVEEVDSLCKLAYNVSFQKAVDSVSRVRLNEIEKYIPAK